MRQRAEEDEEMPKGVVMGPMVVGEEVRAARIGKPLDEQQDEGKHRKPLPHRPRDEDTAPPHQQIKGERKAGAAVDGHQLIDRAENDDQPQQSEDEPAQPSAHHAEADGGIATCNHDVNADVVALSEQAFGLARERPVVERRSGVHQRHSDHEAGDAEAQLPTDVEGGPKRPDAAQCDEDAEKMGERIAPFFERLRGGEDGGKGVHEARGMFF